jgi:hypothetical protein
MLSLIENYYNYILNSYISFLDNLYNTYISLILITHGIAQIHLNMLLLFNFGGWGWNVWFFEFLMCCEPHFGFAIRARACKGVGWKWSPRVTFHVPKSVGRCEGMNPHIPKWATILGVRVVMDFRIFRKNDCRGQNKLDWQFLIPLKDLGMKMFKMGLRIRFEYLKHKLWLKEKSKSNCQFDPWPLKVEIVLIYLRVGGVSHIVGKLLTRVTTLLWTSF